MAEIPLAAYDPLFFAHHTMIDRIWRLWQLRHPTAGVPADLLGAALPRVYRRWAGVYSMVTTDGLYHASEAAPGVTLVTGPGGRGMTCAPAIAEET